MNTLFKRLLGKRVTSDPLTVTIEAAKNGFHITESRIATNYKATYVARDLGELAQVIHQIYMAGTEGES